MNILAIEAEIPGSFCLYNKTKPSTGAFEISHNGNILKFIHP